MYNVATLRHWSCRRDDHQTVEPRVQSRHEPGETSGETGSGFYHGSRAALARTAHSRGLPKDYRRAEKHCRTVGDAPETGCGSPGLDGWARLADVSDRILAVDTRVARRRAAPDVPDPRSDRDALIAATALVHDMRVVTRNVSHFQPSGVAVFNPSEH